MKRYLIVIAIAIIVLGGGLYFFLNRTDTSKHGGGHTAETGDNPVIQSHRSYQIEVISDTTIKLNEPTTFTYKIKNDKGEMLKNYEVAHEKIMHFIVIRKDLQNFQHLHPNFNKQTGEFTVDITFPNDGPYRVFPDFTPIEDNPQKLPVTVYHDIDVGDINRYKAQPVIPDIQPKKIVGEYQITYNFPAEVMMRNEINYNLSIEKNSQPVKDLENYLGALGHSVILKEGSLDFIHTHAEEGNASRGPEIKFSTSFPEDGIYKIFTQFQHQGKVVTTGFIIKVI